jgi:hypothetical protein
MNNWIYFIFVKNAGNGDDLYGIARAAVDGTKSEIVKAPAKTVITSINAFDEYLFYTAEDAEGSANLPAYWLYRTKIGTAEDIKLFNDTIKYNALYICNGKIYFSSGNELMRMNLDGSDLQKNEIPQYVIYAD